MSGEYYVSVSLTANSQAKAEDINTRTESIQAGFDKLPNPHASAPTTKGFSEPFIVDPATLNTHPPTVKQVQEQDAIYGADTGTTNTYAVAMDPAVTAYTEGLSIKVKIANPNDGASTIDVNLLGAKTIAKFGADNLVGGELVAGTIAGLTYDGTKFQLDSWTTVSAPLLDEDDMASNSAIAASSQQAIVTYDAAQIATHAAVTEVHGATGAVVGTTNTQTLTNKTLTAPAINSPTGIVKGDVGLGNVDNTSDATKNAAAVTLTNKTLTAPIISTISNTGALTLPTDTDTLVGRATTDTLTNKTLTAPVISTIDLTGGQIAFPATAVPSADPNTLDDYEEGTFETFLNFGGTHANQVYATRSGIYTKIGNLVTCNIAMILTESGTSTGVASIVGLPFDTSENTAVTLFFWVVTFANQFEGYILPATTYVNLMEITEVGAITTLSNANFADTSRVHCSVSYQI